MSNSERVVDTAIIGAGFAGLGCASTLDQTPLSYRLFEAGSTAGGLARSEYRCGFVFDLAGHWLHSRDALFEKRLAQVSGLELLDIQRSAWIYSCQRWIPYPFQNNLWALPKDVRQQCLDELPQVCVEPDNVADTSEMPDNFLDEIISQWGSGIARHFIKPYNEKLWGCELTQLRANCAGRYLPQTSLKQVQEGAIRQINVTGYNDRFLYPRKGGIGLIANAMARELHTQIEFNTNVVAIDLHRSQLQFADGRTCNYKQLVSTLSLPHLVSLCVKVPENMSRANAELRSTGVHCVNVAVRGPQPRQVPECHWVYFPEKQFLFYRVGCPSTVLASLAPKQCRSFSVEFRDQPGVPDKQLENAALDGLKRCGLIGAADQVLFTYSRKIKTAYVIQDSNWQNSKTMLIDWLRDHNVFSTGRYGAWAYTSMEGAYVAGRRTAHQLLEEPPMVAQNV